MDKTIENILNRNLDAYAGSAIESGIPKKQSKRERAAEQMQNIMMQVNGQHGKVGAEFVGKPISEYTPQDRVLAKLNPELFSISKKYDALKNTVDLSDKEEMNLKNAQKMLFGLGADQAQAIDAGADASQRALAMQKANQMGATQGLAGAAGANLGQMGKIAGEITNQYAPTSQQIEAQRQQALANVSAGMMQIPSTLSAMQAQNVTNAYNRSLVKPTTPSGGTPKTTYTSKVSTSNYSNAPQKVSGIEGKFRQQDLQSLVDNYKKGNILENKKTGMMSSFVDPSKIGK